MALRKLRTVASEFRKDLRANKRLAADAHHLSLPSPQGKRPLFSRHRRDSITELAFFRAFLSWEAFLEESFILFMLGQTRPRGRSPVRYAFPPTQRAAADWVAEGQRFARWSRAAEVSSRAERFFRDGKPFSPVLRGNQNVLDEIRIIRNAVAHSSKSAQEKFKMLVRNKLGVVPPDLTVGNFLGTTIAGSTPPISYFDDYVSQIEFAASRIIGS